MKRRTILSSLAGTILAAKLFSSEAHDAMGKKKRTLLLVHGGWHGGWCWKKLLPLLRAEGHEVFAPTLTGMGERAHLLRAEIDLDTHIRDVRNLLQYEDLQEVVLVGHSYGGMVIAGVCAQEHARIHHVVYLDAFMPDDNKALSDYAPIPPTRDGWRVPPIGPPEAFDVSDPADIAWMAPRLGDQPLATFRQAVRTLGEQPVAPRTTYIQCTKLPWFTEAAQRARQRNYIYREFVDAGHDAMVTRPRPLAALLLAAATD